MTKPYFDDNVQRDRWHFMQSFIAEVRQLKRLNLIALICLAIPYSDEKRVEDMLTNWRTEK